MMSNDTRSPASPTELVARMEHRASEMDRVGCHKCSPKTMREGIAELTRLAAENERLRAIEERAKAVQYANQTPTRAHLPCDVARYILGEGEEQRA
jgi:hypothetical protein